MPEMPTKPPAPPEPKRGSSWLAILLTSMGGVVVIAVLLFLTQGVLGGVLVIGGIVFALTAFHYLVWGWWLEKLIRQADDGDEGDEG